MAAAPSITPSSNSAPAAPATAAVNPQPSAFAEDLAAYEPVTHPGDALPFEPLATKAPIRKTVGSYYMEWVTIHAADLRNLQPGSYWRDRVANDFATTITAEARSRFLHHPEEEDAFWYAVSRLGPTIASNASTVASCVIHGGTNSRALYRVEFGRSGTANRRSLAAGVQATDDLAVALRAPAGPAGLSAGVPVRYTGFPNNDSRSYWSARTGLHDSIASWAVHAGSSNFGRVLVFDAPSPSAFFVQGSNDPSNGLSQLEIVYLGERKPLLVDSRLPRAHRDAIDESLARMTQPGTNAFYVRLGKLHGLELLPGRERLPVKWVVRTYLEQGLRDCELDVRLPLASTNRHALYTLRFQSGESAGALDVLIDRIGDAPAVGYPQPLSLENIQGYHQHNADGQSLRDWWNHRYPGAKLDSINRGDLETAALAALQARSGSPAWFATNYGITILTPAAAARRLKQTHQASSKQTTGLKEFNGEELEALERALQTLPPSVLQELRGTCFLRQAAHPGGGLGASARTAGFTLVTWRNSQVEAKTISIFDAAREGDAILFVGGRRGIFTPLVATYLHEIGHIFAANNGRSALFNRELQIPTQAPITWYAGSNPNDEFLPEAFSLHFADPEWLSENRPEIDQWLTRQCPAN